MLFNNIFNNLKKVVSEKNLESETKYAKNDQFYVLWKQHMLRNSAIMPVSFVHWKNYALLRRPFARN